jgi:hypothetical protein
MGSATIRFMNVKLNFRPAFEVQATKIKSTGSRNIILGSPKLACCTGGTSRVLASVSKGTRQIMNPKPLRRRKPTGTIFSPRMIPMVTSAFSPRNSVMKAMANFGLRHTGTAADWMLLFYSKMTTRHIALHGGHCHESFARIKILPSPAR